MQSTAAPTGRANQRLTAMFRRGSALPVPALAVPVGSAALGAARISRWAAQAGLPRSRLLALPTRRRQQACGRSCWRLCSWPLTLAVALHGRVRCAHGRSHRALGSGAGGSVAFVAVCVVQVRLRANGRLRWPSGGAAGCAVLIQPLALVVRRCRSAALSRPQALALAVGWCWSGPRRRYGPVSGRVVRLQT